MSCPEGRGYITEGLLEGNWRPARWPWPRDGGPQTRTAWAVAAARPLFCKSGCFKSSTCSAQWALVCWDLCLRLKAVWHAVRWRGYLARWLLHLGEGGRTPCCRGQGAEEPPHLCPPGPSSL